MATTTVAPSQSVRSALGLQVSTRCPQLRGVRLPARKVGGRSFSRPTCRRVCSVVADISAPAATDSAAWVPVFSVDDLPKGERRLVRQGAETVLVFWYRNEICAVENSSPAEGAYSEGLFNARLTQEGGITCPVSDSVFDIKTGEVKIWYPDNWIMKTFTSPLRNLQTYDVKVEGGQVYVDFGQPVAPSATEVYLAEVKVGQTVSNVDVTETRMVVDESAGGFGFTPANELTNGRAAMMGFVLLLVIEAVTGKGLLAVTGFLDFIRGL